MLKEVFRFLLVGTLVLCLVLCSVSCGVHTGKKPLITENAVIPKELSSVVGGNDYLPAQRSWDDWAEKAKEKQTVVVKVQKVSSQSYFWDDGKNGVGGITDTVVKLESVLMGYIDGFSDLEVGGEFHIIEHFTVDDKGKTVTPKYTLRGSMLSAKEELEYYINYDERTNPIMEIGKEYIVCMWSGWLLSEYGIHFTLDCRLPDEEKASVVPESYYVNGYINYEIFQFGDAAYADSSAIVSSYTATGNSREGNSYFLYHAMVKEAYERFSTEG